MEKKTAYLGMFSALAIIFGYVEAMLPIFMGVPGIKLGLANLTVLFLLERYTIREAAIVSFIRIAVIGFLFTNLFSILYSLAGAALSLACMFLAKRKTSFSLMGISVAGGVAHNVGQFLIALILVKNIAILYYAPALLLSGVVTGLLIGFMTTEVSKRIQL